jgi:hypothetical protein
MRPFFYVSVCACALVSPGCIVPELRKDNEQLRHNLVELNTNQVMDNLIRASHGLPIIQIDYTCSAQITIDQTAMGMENDAVTNMTTVMAAAAKAVIVMRTVMSTVTGTLTAYHQNQVSMQGSPVLTSDGVYNAYLAYLGMEGSLRVSCDCPPRDTVHLCRKCKKTYYWIPIEFKDQFYDLAMIATTQRDRILYEQDPYVLVNLKELVGRRGKAFLVKTDRTLVTGQNARVELLPGMFADVEADKQDPLVTLYVGNLQGNNQWVITPLGPSKVDLTNMLPMQVKLRGTEPPMMTTKELLNRIQFSVPQALFIDLPAAKSLAATTTK